MRDGGKGDKPRPLGVPMEQFDKNFDAIFGKKKKHECNGLCGEYECKEHQDICKRLHKDNYLDPCGNRCYWPEE